MALTMTRTRTQTTLTKLAEMIANLHGELAYLDGLLSSDAGKTAMQAQAAADLTSEVRAKLGARRLELLHDRGALYATVRQFDCRVSPEEIGSAEVWRKKYGRARTPISFQRRFVDSLG